MIKLKRKTCPNPERLKNNYKYPENKKVLMESSHDKCMYCESKITHIDYGDVEHIKPKSKFVGETYNWDNLGFACVKCNRENKKDKYGLNFINPFDEDPEAFISAWGGIILSNDGNSKGQFTIDIVNLNRPDLLEKRYSELIKFQKMIDLHNAVQNEDQKQALKEQILQETDESKEYSVSKKSLLDANGFNEN